MKNVIIIVAIIVIAFVAVYVARNLSRKPMAVVEQTSVTVQKEDLMKTAVKEQSGPFVNGDAVHKGSGEAVIYQTKDGPILAFENFSVTVGPDVFVYLSKNNLSEKRELGEFVSLGKIKAFKGDQTYNLPANYKDYHSAVVWCRSFGVLFAYAAVK